MRALVGQLARFGTVGGVATVLHLLVAWVAARGFDLSAFAANGVGYLCAFASSYLGHFYWTFGRTDGHQVRLPRFIIVSGIGFALTNLVIFVAVTLAGLPFEAALLGILGSVPVTTWALSRWWAFR